MSRNSSPGAVEVRLPEALENRLKFYSIAAAAAGVSVLALMQPAEAEVVITHKIIPVPENGTVSIDINHDGIADFEFATIITGTSNGQVGWFNSSAIVEPLVSGGGVVGGTLYSRPGPYASALKRDVMISGFKHFSSKGKTVIGRVYGGCSTKATSCPLFVVGNWNNDPPNSYLGVKFPIDGETHYGWVRLKTTYYGSEVEIESYAYETDPNTPICTREVQPCPAPPADRETGQNVSIGPSLGMLALGADGLALWRRAALAF